MNAALEPLAASICAWTQRGRSRVRVEQDISSTQICSPVQVKNFCVIYKTKRTDTRVCRINHSMAEIGEEITFKKSFK